MHLLLVAATALAAEPAPPPHPTTTPDHLTVVFRARSRPVRIALAVTHAGRPLGDRWAAHARTLFAGYDRDKDGFLNAAELDSIYPVAGVREMFDGGFYYRVSAQPPEMDEIDRNGDNRVSPEELLAYYGELTADLLRPRPILATNTNRDAVTEQLFARLDRNRDGQLTREEVRDAERVLARLDTDEDECVSSDEILSNRATLEATTMTTTEAALMMTAPKKDKPTSTASTDLAVYPAGVPATAISALFKRYDTNSDAALSPAEIGFEPATFARLDTDRNGTLALGEFDSWRTHEPDAVVVVDMADTPDACKVVVDRPGSWPKDLDVRQSEPGRVVLRAGTQTVELGAYVPPESLRRRQAEELLTGAFPGGKTEVTEKELVSPQTQLVRVVFESADANADGKLTRTEFDSYFARQRTTAEVALTVTFATRTPNLFQMLDDNQDGKLSVRELRTAWDRLIVLEPGGATAVTRAVIQPAATLRVTPTAFVNVEAAMFTPPARTKTSAGPLWMQKMDRNGDGSVSRIEFLGDVATFDRLDTDSDGLVSTTEAVAYDQIARPPKAKPAAPAKK